MKEAIPFRAWFYFRMGWATYFAFIFAAVNTLTVTYFLAIENYPSLQVVFPSFVYYIVIVSLIGVPLLVGIGYIHFKKSPSFRAESAVFFESNPWALRDLVNSEYNLVLSFKILQMITKLTKQENLDQNELDQIRELEKELKEILESRTGRYKKDLEFFKTLK
tara:strand:- start:11 stop:499 length:489 start_codon:yes stop_codon:yes gene_type:complete